MRYSSQDESVIAYIDALEFGDTAAAELQKNQIKYFTDQTFDFSVPETNAMYAHLKNKLEAYKSILQHELFPKFHLPERKIMLMCALQYGFVGMIDLLISKETITLLESYCESVSMKNLYNVYSIKHIMSNYPYSAVSK